MTLQIDIVTDRQQSYKGTAYIKKYVLCKIFCKSIALLSIAKHGRDASSLVICNHFG